VVLRSDYYQIKARIRTAQTTQLHLADALAEQAVIF